MCNIKAVSFMYPSKKITLAWFFYTTSGCDGCDKYEVCQMIVIDKTSETSNPCKNSKLSENCEPNSDGFPFHANYLCSLQSVDLIQMNFHMKFTWASTSLSISCTTVQTSWMVFRIPILRSPTCSKKNAEWKNYENVDEVLS